jgi:hypothetical protein
MADATNGNRPFMIRICSTPVDEGIRNGSVALVVLAYAGEGA